MWPFTKPVTKADVAAPPVQDNPYAFVVPSYRRGGPYSEQAVPQGAADALGSHSASEHAAESIKKQQRARPFGTYPPAGIPPDGWLGYKQDNYNRSERDEWLLYGVPQPERQIFHRMALNPYWNANHVNRPQHAPHDYSFLRNPDWNYIGRRDLTGEHYSQGQTVTDQNSVALKGQRASQRRRSTFRLEPIQFGENTLTVSQNSGYVPASASFVSPTAPGTPSSFRLT